MSQASTKPEVFIIESLDPEDEGNGHFEGVVLTSILRMRGMSPKYKYVRTIGQFKKAVKAFGKSNYRYLHISAHANQSEMYLTNEETISPDLLGKIMAPYLDGKRAFLSACSMASPAFANAIFKHTKCRSLAGPDDDVEFASAALMWASVYHLMFSETERGMKDKALQKHLRNASNLFQIPTSYFLRTGKTDAPKHIQNAL